MSNVTSFDESWFPRDHASKRAKCICITRSTHVEVTTLLQRNKEKKN